MPTSRRQNERRGRRRVEPAGARPWVLFVGADRRAVRDLAAILRDLFALEAAADTESALESLDRRAYAAVVLRIGSPGKPADLAPLRRLHGAHPHVPIYILTPDASAETAFSAGRVGATAFLPPVESPEEIAQALRAIWTRQHSRRKPGEDPERILWHFVGRSEAIRRLLEDAETVATVNSTVLITGEHGTGKEVLARWIHHQGPRAAGAFVAVNCPAIPENLFESELFGHEPGSFTGARDLRRGRFELAAGGVLFLDEITETPVHLQPKLLRALDTAEFYRVGAERPLTADARVICSSNRDLQAEVANGRFREDLFYRINVVWFHIPPLRERREDIPLLAQHFLRHTCAELGKTVEGFAPEALSFLVAYDWPGNVRELSKLIERAVIFCHTPRIGPELLAPVAARTPLLSLPWDDARELVLRQFERNYVSALLRIYGGAVSRVAQAMGITRQALYKAMERAQLDPALFRPRLRRSGAARTGTSRRRKPIA
jgi:DNA-binding NtrC family response regulator